MTDKRVLYDGKEWDVLHDEYKGFDLVEGIKTLTIRPHITANEQKEDWDGPLFKEFERLRDSQAERGLEENRECPFCGNKALETRSWKDAGPGVVMTVECFACGARGPTIRPKDDQIGFAAAYKAWNERVTNQK